MELNWRSDVSELALVRSLDTQNYDLVRLRPSDAGIAEEHFSIARSLEKRRTRKLITVAHWDPDVRVALEVNGPNLALYLENELVDSWADDRLSHASLGLMENRGDKAAAHMIRIIYPDDSWQGAASSLLQQFKSAAARLLYSLASF